MRTRGLFPRLAVACSGGVVVGVAKGPGRVFQSKLAFTALPPFRWGAELAPPSTPVAAAGASMPPAAMPMGRAGAEFRPAGASPALPGGPLAQMVVAPFSPSGAPASPSAAPTSAIEAPFSPSDADGTAGAALQRRKTGERGRLGRLGRASLRLSGTAHKAVATTGAGVSALGIDGAMRSNALPRRRCRNSWRTSSREWASRR
jgi:hypothetical protein